MPDTQTSAAAAKQAAEIVRVLSAARGKLIVLYGKRGTGKSELLHETVLPLLAEQGPVGWAECSDQLPCELQIQGRNTPIDWSSLPAGTILLDDFDRILSLPDRPRREELRKLLAAVRAGSGACTLAVVVRDQDLRDIFSLRDVAPELAENLVPLPEFSLAEGLEGLAAAEAGGPVSYDPALLKALQEDLDSEGATGASPALAQAIHSEFVRSPSRRSGVPIGLLEYRAAGRLRGILESYLGHRLQHLEADLGPDAAVAAQAVLENIVSSAGATPDLRDVPPRLGISEQTVTSAIQWLQQPPALMRPLSCGGFDVRPVQLAGALQARLEEQRQEIQPAQRFLAEAVRAWQELGTLIPEERFDDLHRRRRQLCASPDQASLMAHFALRYGDAGDFETPRYWIARLPEQSERVSTLVRALFELRADVRIRAAGLLGDYDQPDVRHQLYRLALEDPEAPVRRQALDALQRLTIEEFRDRVGVEAVDCASPYRQNAVEALRLFHDPSTAALLENLLVDPATEPPIRAAVVDTLAALATPASIDALVRVALHGESQDREAAATALATIRSQPLQARALETLRRPPLAPRPPVRVGAVVSTVFQALLALLVVVANCGLHGLALLVLRRYKLAALFFSIEVAGVAAAWVGHSGAASGVAVLALFANLLASQLLAFRAAESSSAPSRFASILGFLLLLANLPTTFLVAHGLASLMMKRVRRGLALFGLELLGVACFVILLAYPDLFVVANLPVSGFANRLAQVVPRLMKWFYGLSAIGLFYGSWIVDIAGAGYLALRTRRSLEADSRRNRVYQALLANPDAAAVVLAALQGSNAVQARWARRLLCRFARVLPPQQLVDCLAQSATPGPVLRALARVRREESLPALAALWPTAGGSVRGRILRALVHRPSEGSLRSLKALLPEAGAWWRLRYCASWLNYRIRLWPKPLLMLGTWLLPLALVLLYEGVATTNNRARPLLKSISGAVGVMAKPGWKSGQQPGTSDQERLVAETARFLARRYPKESQHGLVEIFSSLLAVPDPALQETRRAMVESLVIIVADPVAINFEAREALAKALKDQKLRPEMLSLLVQMARYGPRQQPGRLSVERLQKAAGSLLASNVEIFQQALASDLDPDRKRPLLDALEAVGTPEAAGALKAFVLSSDSAISAELDSLARVDPKRAENAKERLEGTREVQLAALASLRRMGKPEEHAVLDEIARTAASSEIRRAAASEVTEMLSTAAAKAALDRDDPRSAITLAERVRDAGPDAEQMPDVVFVLGAANYRLALEPGAPEERLNDAITYLQQARTSRPDDTQTAHLLALGHAARARRYLNAPRIQDAEAEAGRAIEADPLCSDAYIVQGSILLAKGDRTGALRAFARASELDPRSSSAYFVQAVILFGDRDYPQAENLALKAIEADPKDAWNYQLLRQIYVGQNRVPEAVNLFERLSQRYDSVPLWQQLAYLHHDWMAPTDPRSYERAYEINRRVYANARDSAERQSAEANFAEANLTTGRYRDAVNLADKLLAGPQAAKYEIPMLTIAYAALVAAGDHPAAAARLEQLDKAVRNPHAPSAWTYRGTLHYLQTSAIPQRLKDPLIQLVAAIDRDANPLPPPVLAANRAALRK
ncbi:MAG: HEAT repeat domain-containing protein [Bryobacteraceae bacterium]|jgi:hypothetical protein